MYNDHREPRSRRRSLSAPPAPPAPPHLHNGAFHHHPPHVRTSMIRLIYDDAAIARLELVYEDVDYVIDLIETSPPEIKLTLALALGINVDLSEYPQDFYPPIRFETPFLNEINKNSISASLDCAEPEIAVSIYNTCPPEQALLALAVAALIKTEDEA